MTREQAIRQILDEMPYAIIRGSGEFVTIRRELLLVAFGYPYPIDEQRITPNLRPSDLEHGRLRPIAHVEHDVLDAWAKDWDTP